MVADIVAFVPRGNFPRSRLGEKQRGKVLASWVTRKLRTIAQFSIRDSDGLESLFADAPQPRASKDSKPGSVVTNSLRRSTTLPEGEVPRSPARVPEEIHELQSESHPNTQEPKEPPAVRSSATALDTGAPVPRIADPTHVAGPHSASSSEANSGRSALDQLDFGSDFGQFTNRRGSVPPAELSSPAEPPALQLPQGRDSLPSQKRFSSIPTSSPFAEHHGSQDMAFQPGSYDENTEGWQQEALMYQTAWGEDGGAHGQEEIHGAPSNADEVTRNRYDEGYHGY